MQSKQVSQLKKCPFCNDNAELQQDGEWYYVMCLGCMASFEKSRSIYRSTAINDWNARAGVAEIEAAAVERAAEELMAGTYADDAWRYEDFLKEWAANRRKEAQG